MRWLKRALMWLIGIAVVGYVCFVAALYFGQRSMLYQPPQKMRTAPAAAGFPQAEEVILNTPDGEKVIAWHVVPQGERPIVVFFHGNGDSIALRTPRFRDLTSDGTGLLALSFRGYAGSSGEPTEQGLLLDAEAAYAFVASRYPKERIVLWGFSLGTGPAVMMAAKHPVAKLVLEAPYTSTVDIAAAIFPFVPVRLLMKDQFRSDLHIGKIAAPLLVMHGEHDQAIAFRFGKTLFAMAPEPKKFVAFPLGIHENLDRYGATGVVRDFIYAKTPG